MLLGELIFCESDKCVFLATGSCDFFFVKCKKEVRNWSRERTLKRIKGVHGTQVSMKNRKERVEIEGKNRNKC